MLDDGSMAWMSTKDVGPHASNADLRTLKRVTAEEREVEATTGDRGAKRTRARAHMMAVPGPDPKSSMELGT